MNSTKTINTTQSTWEDQQKNSIFNMDNIVVFDALRSHYTSLILQPNLPAARSSIILKCNHSNWMKNCSSPQRTHFTIRLSLLNLSAFLIFYGEPDLVWMLFAPRSFESFETFWGISCYKFSQITYILVSREVTDRLKMEFWVERTLYQIKGKIINIRRFY